MKKYTIEAIERYLRYKDPERPVLHTVQRTKAAGNQFILNGFSAYMFKEHFPELDTFEQTAAANSINYDMIAPQNCPPVILTDDDHKVWKHADQFSQWLKTRDDAGRLNMIYVFGDLFDIRMIREAKNMIGPKLDGFSFQKDRRLSPLLINTPKIEALLLPCRADDYDTWQKRTREFLDACEKKAS